MLQITPSAITALFTHYLILTKHKAILLLKQFVHFMFALFNQQWQWNDKLLFSYIWSAWPITEIHPSPFSDPPVFTVSFDLRFCLGRINGPLSGRKQIRDISQQPTSTFSDQGQLLVSVLYSLLTSNNSHLSLCSKTHVLFIMNQPTELPPTSQCHMENSPQEGNTHTLLCFIRWYSHMSLNKTSIGYARIRKYFSSYHEQKLSITVKNACIWKARERQQAHAFSWQNDDTNTYIQNL